MKYPTLKNFVNGQFTESTATRTLQVISPLDGTLLTEVPMSTAGDLNDAVEGARAAFHKWSKTPIKERVQVFFRYKFLLEKNLPELATICSEENGKTMSEAIAEIEKCIELTEFATSLPQLVTGEVLEVSKGVECRTEHVPLGVVASIVPFNFPSMVPNWTIPNAIALGNCMIIKPSEKVPISCGRLAELLKEAGLPDGVFSIVHGDSDIVEAICDHPGIDESCKDGLPACNASIQALPGTGWCKKPSNGNARCDTDDDSGKRGGKYEWVRGTALYGSECNGGGRRH
jgi:malonate-semialdehyde dehydrogenase (acetylating) / methylmalonate-semialdehyde dehydrogenase